MRVAGIRRDRRPRMTPRPAFPRALTAHSLTAHSLTAHSLITLALLSLVPCRAAMAQSPRASAPGPGPNWKAVVEGRPVYITPDSIAKAGSDSYRYVVFRRLGDAESVETAEVRCADHTWRTLRTVTRGKYIPADKKGNHVKVQETPKAPFVNAYPGGAADVMAHKVCDMAHVKFRAAKKR